MQKWFFFQLEIQSLTSFRVREDSSFFWWNNHCKSQPYNNNNLKMALFGSDINDVNTLSSLLNESRAAQEEKSKVATQPPSSTTPSTIVLGSGKTVDSATGREIASNKKRVSDPKDIWTDEEILPEDAITDMRGNRPTPRYEFNYKQAVGTEDTFLGLGDKSPLSSDCTHLVVKIHFPQSSLRELDLDITKNRVRASSKYHYLFTYLPVDVDPDRASAKFDSKKEVLSVTLPIVFD